MTNSHKNTVMHVAWVGLQPRIACDIRLESDLNPTSFTKPWGLQGLGLSGAGCHGPRSPPAGAAGKGAGPAESGARARVTAKNCASGCSLPALYGQVTANASAWIPQAA